MTKRAEKRVEELAMMRPTPSIDGVIDDMLALEWPALEAGWVVHRVYGLTMPDAVHRVGMRAAPVIGKCGQWKPYRYPSIGVIGDKNYCEAPVRTFSSGSTFCDKGHKDPAVQE